MINKSKNAIYKAKKIANNGSMTKQQLGSSQIKEDIKAFIRNGNSITHLEHDVFGADPVRSTKKDKQIRL